MEIIILGFCVILIGLYGSKAIMMHKGYNNQLYAVLFASYLEYFYRNIIRHDCSTSTLLKAKLGTHKMSFTTIQSHDGQLISHYVLLFYNKGIACISYLNPNGSIHGSMNEQHWTLHQNGKRFKFSNPMIECKLYSKRIKKLCPHVSVHEYIACPDACDIHGISGPIYHYSAIVDTLKAVNHPYISEELITSSYQDVSTKKGL